jgi:hypothetical protein
MIDDWYIPEHNQGIIGFPCFSTHAEVDKKINGELIHKDKLMTPLSRFTVRTLDRIYARAYMSHAPYSIYWRFE